MIVRNVSADVLRVVGIQARRLPVSSIAIDRFNCLLVRDLSAMFDQAAAAAHIQSHAQGKSPTKWIPEHKNLQLKNCGKNMIDAACGRLRNKI